MDSNQMDSDQDKNLNDGANKDIQEHEGTDGSSYELAGVDKQQVDEGTSKEPSPIAIHTCEFCGKNFSSGKALGGHKRFHLQAQRKEKEANQAKKANCDNTQLSFLMSSGKLRCYLCNKDFPSEKSLFGHMRSHPNRDWRGIHPPTHHDKHSSCSSKIDSMELKKENDNVGAASTPNKPVIDLSKSLPSSWLKTNKRGRESVVDEAARVLVALLEEVEALGGLSSLKVSKPKEGRDFESGRLKSGKTLFKFGDGRVSRNMNSEEEEQQARAMVNKNKKGKLIVKLKTQDSKFEEDNSSPIKTSKTQEDGYQCSTCDKSFPTFQALGGHRSNHNKEKNNSVKDEQRLLDDMGESSQSSPKNWNFDLNELPDVMEDEEN